MGVITVIPKDGDLTDWRPITQTPLFVKLLEKWINVQFLNFFIDILSEFQLFFYQADQHNWLFLN